MQEKQQNFLFEIEWIILHIYNLRKEEETSPVHTESHYKKKK